MLLGACSHEAVLSGALDSGEVQTAEDGSTAGCTSQGGTCVPYVEACPPPQQSAALCEDTVLLCCLPAGREASAGFLGETEADSGAGADENEAATAADATL